MDRGGIEVETANLETLTAALTRENHTLKRALTDPRLFSGIGNAYSDEILHRAQLSPLKLTAKLDPEEIERLYRAARDVLAEWTARLGQHAVDSFPTKVTAFREGMAVHGRYRKPCPVCGAPCSAHRLCRKRVQLLSGMPDRGQDPGRPRALETPARGLAEAARRPGRASKATQALKGQVDPITCGILITIKNNSSQRLP